MGRFLAASAASASQERMNSRRLLITLYIAAVFLYWIALYLYASTLPTYVQSKSDNLKIVGTILSMYGLWQAIIRLPLGIAADWLGRRKPFLIAGFALAALGAWLMGTANGANGLLIGRAVTGLAAGTWVPLVAVFSSLFPPEEAVRASSLLTLVGSIARVLATSANGPLNQWGGYPLAFFLAAGAAAVAIFIVLPIRDQVRPPKRPSLKSTGALIVRRDVLLPSALSAVGQYANWAATYGFIPILAKQLGATDITQSILLSMNLLVATFGNLIATTVVNRIGAQRMVYATFVVVALGLAGAAFAHSLPLLFVAQFCVGLSQGIGYPVLMGMSIRHVADGERTTAMGLHQAVYAIGMFGGPALSGVLADAMGIRPMFAVTAAACLVIGVIATRWLEPKPATD